MSTKRDERYEKIDDFRIEFDDLPDGAFFALAEERGITVDDWAWFSDEYKRRNPELRP